MIIQIISNKYCKNSYYKKIDKNNDFEMYLEEDKAKINNDQVKSTLHI